MLLHISTLSRPPQGVRIHYLAKLHKYINCNCCNYVTWQGNEYEFPEDGGIVPEHVEA